MFSCRLPSLSSRRSRRLWTAVALAAYLFAIVGFPVPLPAKKRDARAPFPCQDHHCGCHSAEQCWQSCCCFTPAQRLAWAKKHNVQIPADVRTAMLCQSSDDHAASAGCCAHDDDHDHDVASAPHACQNCREPQPAGKVGWVFGFQAQKCQGITMLWVAVGATLPLEIRSLWEFDWSQVDQVRDSSRILSSLSWQPSVPPPRA